MPLPGGPSNKFGGRYEKWWTVSQLIRIIEGQADSLRIEDPAYPKAEFVLAAGYCREFHQTKRSNRGNWSLHSLKGEDLLQAMFEYLTQDCNALFVFVSDSKAPELRDLAERASDAINLEEFKSGFTSSMTQKRHLSTLKSVWGNPDDTVTYNLLQRIEVRTIDERGIEEQVRQSLSLLFLSNVNEICDAMRALVEDSIHKVIDRNLLDSTLKERGFISRRLPNPKNAPMLVDEVTNDYLNRIGRQLINKTLIPRSNFQTLLAALKENETNTDCIVTGNAGGGKTASILELVNILRQNDAPPAVLAFRLDGMEPVPSTKALGEHLGLEESPALVLKAAAEVQSGEAVLIIDQLDAVSSTSGRRLDFFDVIKALLEEVNACRNAVKFHIVLVCRKFDWENDHRLCRSLAKEPIPITVSDFSQEEVRTILLDHGFDSDSIRKQNLKLLGLPQNLAMFLEISNDADIQSSFTSVIDLYDEYWNVKRQSVKRRADSGDHWIDVIQQLCDEMSSSQQLSVPKEVLDRFPAEYVNSMTSEGVLSYYRRRYRFSHESFFDYCFARDYFLKSISLTDFLKGSEQHLFRRAQVRQILEYLHDAKLERYCSELNALLKDDKIRYHLKDLAIALAFKFTDPGEIEWNVLEPRIYSEVKAIECGQKNVDEIASTVWDLFFHSQSWFPLADSKGLIASWLESGSDRLVDMAVDYMKHHHSQYGDRVAELLEPYAGYGGNWPVRFCNLMQWPKHGNSRRFFDLFLRLIDQGTLDDAYGRSRNDPFWGIFYGLSNDHPERSAQMLGHWLNRRLAIILETKTDPGWKDWYNLFDNRHHGTDDIQTSAHKAPEAFIRHVMPVVLRISNLAVHNNSSPPPRRDEVWLTFSDREHVTIPDACLKGLCNALENLAKNEPDWVWSILDELRQQETHLANYLLLKAYTAGAEHFADEAMLDVCDNTWRFECENADELVSAIFPVCSDKNRLKLENTILNYLPDREKIPEALSDRGRASFFLLSFVPSELLSENARRRFGELERKLGRPKSHPKTSDVVWLQSPIDKPAMEKMTDEHWLRAIEKYDTKTRPFDKTDPSKGGALELARTMQDSVKDDPDRFARLCLEFKAEAHPVYLEHVLLALKETEISTELKLQVCRKGFAESRDHCGMAIADVLGSIEAPLPDDTIEMLDWLATESTQFDLGLWMGGPDGNAEQTDLLTKGINSTRGRSAIAIGDLIRRDATYVERFTSTIEKLVRDRFSAVRACAANILIGISFYDREYALCLFQKLVESCGDDVDADSLLATRDVEQFINYCLRDDFECLQPVITRMLESSKPNVRQAGARLAGLAALYRHDAADSLVEEVLRGDSFQRLGLAEVAARNISHKECRDWSVRHLLRFFNDTDQEVRREASSCFSSLKNEPLDQYEDLINSFCESDAFEESSWYLVTAIEKSSHRLPGMTYVVCAKLLDLPDDGVRDRSARQSANLYTVPTLILRVYHQHQQDEWTVKCLDLIDLMYRNRIREIRWHMEKFER